MTHALQETIQWNDIICGSTTYGRRFKEVWGKQWGIGKHAKATAICDLIGQNTWDRYFTFSLVRHPLDRIKSKYFATERKVMRHGLNGWRQWMRRIWPRFRRKIYERPPVRAYLDTSSFSEFLFHPALKEIPLQSDFICSSEYEEIIVDKTYKIENINENLEDIVKHCGVDIKMRKKNRSNNSVKLDMETGKKKR